MKQVTLKSGDKVPVLGLGTWRMGERKSERAAEVAAIRLGLDLGITLIDTAEMYGEGGAEEVIAEAIAGRRDSPSETAAASKLASCTGVPGPMRLARKASASSCSGYSTVSSPQPFHRFMCNPLLYFAQ